MNSWKVIFATVVIFAAGVVTGGLLVRQTALRPLHPVHRQLFQMGTNRPAPASLAGNVRLDFLRRAQRDLDLTPEQRTHIDEILKHSQERSKKVMEVVAPKLREELQKTRDEFRDVLTAEQRSQFDKLWKQSRRSDQRPGARERMVPSPEPSHSTSGPTNSPAS